MNFTARFFDGKKTRGFDAIVTLFPEGLKIAFTDNDQQHEIYWPKDNLQVMERHHDDKPAMIGYKGMLGARLIISEKAHYKSVLPLISKRHIKLSHVHHPWRIFWLVVVIVVLILLVPIWRGQVLSTWVAKVLPYEWELVLWQQIIKPNFKGKTECIAPKGRKALDKMVSKLAAHTHSNHPFDVRILNAPKIINAESLPGFHLILYSGILAMDDPDALAAVLAHEMSHSLEHHVTAKFIYLMGMNMYLRIVFGLSHKDMTFDFINLKYSRDYEHVADDMGISILKKANINPNAFERAMKFLEKTMGRDFEGIEPYLVDHPPYKERMDKVKSNGSAKQTPSLSKQEWQDLKSICSQTKPLEFQENATHQQSAE